MSRLLPWHRSSRICPQVKGPHAWIARLFTKRLLSLLSYTGDTAATVSTDMFAAFSPVTPAEIDPLGQATPPIVVLGGP